MMTITENSSRKEKEKCAKELNSAADKLTKELAKANALCKKTNYFVDKERDTLLKELSKVAKAKEDFLREAHARLPFLGKDLATTVALKGAEIVMLANEAVSRMHCLSKGMMDLAEKGDRAAVINTADKLLQKEFNTATLDGVRQGVLAKDARLARAIEAMSVTCP